MTTENENVRSEISSIEANLQNTVPGSSSKVDQSATPNQNKRKRESSTDSRYTPFRPKNAKGTTPRKKLVDTTENEDPGHWTDELKQLNPVPLPENVVAIFTKPHIFPKQQNHEFLKGIGFPPKIFIPTTDNQTSVVNYRAQNAEAITKQVKRRARKTSIDRALHDRNPQTNNEFDTSISTADNSLVSKPKPATLVVECNGAINVTVNGQVIEFPVSTVSITRNNITYNADINPNE